MSVSATPLWVDTTGILLKETISLKLSSTAPFNGFSLSVTEHLMAHAWYLWSLWSGLSPLASLIFCYSLAGAAYSSHRTLPKTPHQLHGIGPVNLSVPLPVCHVLSPDTCLIQVLSFTWLIKSGSPYSHIFSCLPVVAFMCILCAPS